MRWSGGEDRRIQSGGNDWVVQRDDTLLRTALTASEETERDGARASEEKVRFLISIKPFRRSRSRQFGGGGEDVGRAERERQEEEATQRKTPSTSEELK